jgi:hypothetical protein
MGQGWIVNSGSPGETAVAPSPLARFLSQSAPTNGRYPLLTPVSPQRPLRYWGFFADNDITIEYDAAPDGRSQTQSPGRRSLTMNR